MRLGLLFPDERTSPACVGSGAASYLLKSTNRIGSSVNARLALPSQCCPVETSPPVTLELRDEVAVITLRRPGKLNALSWQMVSDLRALLAQVAENRTARVLILTGEGRG